jgi:hypothetical protein
VGNSLNLLAYDLFAAPELGPVTDWSLAATGARGQTNFIFTNVASGKFIRAAVATR